MTQRAEAKQASLKKILDIGSRRLRQEGLAGAAIAPVMAEAGLTHGAFYSHFPDKEALAIAAFRHALVDGRPRWIGTKADASWPARVARLARHYLRPKHRDDPGTGCPYGALAMETARASPAFRAAFEDELRISLNAVGDPEGAPTIEPGDAAIALVALCVGGLALSRAVADPKFSDRILMVSVQAAETLAAHDAA